MPCGIVYCTCGICLCPTDKTRKLDKDRFDTSSIPNCVIKNCPTHGARHGNTGKQIIYHVAHNAYKRCLKKKYDGMLDRFLNSPRYRASQTEHGWTEELCAKYDAPALEDHSYTYTAWEHGRLASTWKLQSKTDRWQNHLIMHKQYLSKIAHIKNQAKRRREFIPVNKVDSEVTTHSQKQVQRVRVWTAKRDGGGIRHPLHGMLLNPGGHRLFGTNIFLKRKCCRISLPGNSDSLRDFFSHTFRCRICLCGSCVRVRHYKVISIHVSGACVSDPEIHFTFTLVQHFFPDLFCTVG